jgi:hypothetical protein
MTTFDRRIEPLLIRLTRVERDEAVLAERAERAAARSADIGPSTKRVAGQFPKIDRRNPRPRLAGDPLRHEQRPLRPISPLLRQQWRARRRTLAAECSALVRATESALVEAAIADTQRASLTRRSEAARRARRTHQSAAGAAGWRRLLRWFFPHPWKNQSPAATEVDVHGALTRASRLAETIPLLKQQQMQFQSLLSQLQRMKQLHEECEANLNALSE